MQNKPWTKKQIEQHKKAGEKLGFIKDELQQFLAESKNSLTESDCINFVKKSYKKHNLINDNKKEFAIVAFGENTKEVHYFPLIRQRRMGDRSKNGLAKNEKLKPNTLILLDIWARLPEKNAPYADATFMFYFGKSIPKDIQKTWKILVEARDTALNFLKQKIKRRILPRGLEIDRISHDVIGKNGLGHSIKHTIGHSLGFDSPHGKLPGINWREYSPILKNVGYTIEPGIYLEKFGMRTEIDFYIDEKFNLIITTPIQKEIQLLTP